MPPYARTNWRNDHILGKQGRKYKIADLEAILKHYSIRPTQCTPRKPNLLQQLSLLTHTHHLTKTDRYRITKRSRKQKDKQKQKQEKARKLKKEKVSGRKNRDRVKISDLGSKIRKSKQVKKTNRTKSSQCKSSSNSSKPLRSIIPQQTQCQICLDTLSCKKFPKRRITTKCTHEPLICRSCIRHYVTLQIHSPNKHFNSEGQYIKCPLSCPEKMEFERVRKYAADEDFERYERDVLVKSLEGEDGFRLCRGEGCKSGQFWEVDDESDSDGEDEEEDSIWVCGECGYKMCWECDVEWHEGMSCDEYSETIGKRRMEELELSMKFLEETTKICPGENCGLHVEKIDGCDHMTCHKCNHQFCWRCLNPYTTILRDGSSGHKESCPYFNSLLPGNALLDPEGYLDENGNVRAWPNVPEDDEVDMIGGGNGFQNAREQQQEEWDFDVPEEVDVVEEEGVAAELAEQIQQSQQEEEIRDEQERRRARRRERRRVARRRRRQERRAETWYT